MRPIRLEIQAFESYLDKTVIPFDKLGTSGLYLIDGATGAGKTTLFQAIYYALYGETLGGSKKDGNIETTNEDLRNNKAPIGKDTYVDLIFEEKDNIYHIHREPSQRKLASRKTESGYVESKAFVEFSKITSLDEDNKIMAEESLGSKTKEVNEKVEKLLGLDASQFEKTILIPQGKFVEVLSQNTDKRTEIFRSLFDTEGYYNFVNILSKKANDAQSGLSSELKKQNMIFDGAKAEDDDIENKELLNKYKEKSSTEERLCLLKTLIEKYRRSKESAKEKEDELSKHLQKLSTIRSAYDTYDKNKSNLASAQNYIDENDPKLKSKIEELENLKAQDPTFDSYAKEAIEISNQLKSYDDLKTYENDLTRYKNDTIRLQGEIKQGECKINQLDAELTSLESELSSIKEDPDSLLVKLANKCLPRINKLESNKEIANKQYNNIKFLKSNLLNTVLERKILSVAALESLNEYNELSRRYIEGQAGELAFNLKDGDACPVCGSKDHPSKASRTNDSITKKMVDDAQAKHNDAKSRFDRKEAKEQELSKQFESSLDEAIKALKDYGATNESDLSIAIDKLNDELLEIKSNYDSKKNELTSLSTKKKHLTNEIKDKKDEKSILDASLGNSKEKLAACISKIESLDENIRKLKTGLKYQNKFEANSKIAELDKLCSSHKKEAESITSQINTLTSALSEKRGQIKSLRSAIDEFESKNYQDRDFLEQDYNFTDSAKTKYRNEHTKYSILEQTNQTTLDNLNKSIESTKDLQKLADRLNHLSATFGGKGSTDNSKSTIEIYVQGKQLDRVLGYANKRLLAMTDNQFSMSRAKQAYDKVSTSGLDIDIVDNQNMTSEGNRKVVTLSGGESFKAALSLSLGLRDAVAAHKGGTKIDCMYIDEGFGTLDGESLDKVIEILMQQTVDKGNCLVGVISHVEELQSKIPNKIKVFKDSDGNSDIEIIVPNK